MVSVWECCGEERLDVRQSSRGVGGFSCEKSEGAECIAQHTLLPVCHHVASVLAKGSAIIAW